MSRTRGPAAVLFLLLGVPAPLLAQPVLKAAEAAAAPDDKPSPFTQDSQVNFSGLFNQGNISMVSGKAQGHYQLRFLRHALRFEGAAGLAGQAQDTDASPATGFEVPLQRNLNTMATARVRYDFFLSSMDTVYGAYVLSHDSATNLAMRNRVEGGYRRFLLQQPKQALSVESGVVYSLDYAPLDGDSSYDGKVDVFRDRSRFENTGGVVAGRFMLSYNLSLLDNLTLSQTVEILPNLFPEVEAPFERARMGELADGKLGVLEATVLTSNTQVNVTLWKNVTAGMVITFVYDNGAIARRNAYSNADLSVAASMGFKLL